MFMACLSTKYMSIDLPIRKLFLTRILSKGWRVLEERRTHAAPARRFRDELEDHMADHHADPTPRALTSWGRYAEIFAYDEGRGVFSLDDPG
jgi:hypothetical protein